MLKALGGTWLSNRAKTWDQTWNRGWAGSSWGLDAALTVSPTGFLLVMPVFAGGAGREFYDALGR